MSAFTNSLFSSLLSWVRALAASIWGALSGEENSLLIWIGGHWKALVIGLCVFGALADLAVYLFRWRPYRVWISFFRRLRGRKNRAEDRQTGTPEDWDAEPSGAPAPGRHRRAERHAARGVVSRVAELLRGEMEEDRTRLRRIEPARRAEDAYTEPYIPPQWQAPQEENTLPSRRMRRSGHD